jgi:hypothetical protein
MSFASSAWRQRRSSVVLCSSDRGCEKLVVPVFPKGQNSGHGPFDDDAGCPNRFNKHGKFQLRSKHDYKYDSNNLSNNYVYSELAFVVASG